MTVARTQQCDEFFDLRVALRRKNKRSECLDQFKRADYNRSRVDLLIQSSIVIVNRYMLAPLIRHNVNALRVVFNWYSECSRIPLGLKTMDQRYVDSFSGLRSHSLFCCRARQDLLSNHLSRPPSVRVRRHRRLVPSANLTLLPVPLLNQ